MKQFFHYLTWSYVWQGAWLTLQVSVASLVGAVIIGVIVAEARLSRFRPVRASAAAYTWIIRGTPLLLQLIFLFDALPSVGIVMNPLTTAILGFSLNEGAFFGEIIRGGRASVSQAQLLAAESLGMSPWVARRRIILPQAMRAIIPSLGNELIALIKGTSLATVISVNELTTRAQFISSQTFLYFPVYCAVGVIYLAMTTVVSVMQRGLERHYSLEHVTPTRSDFARRWLSRTPSSSKDRSDEPSEPSPARGADPQHHLTPPQTIVARSVAATPTSPADENFVMCRAVRKRYGDVEVLKGVNLTIRRGEVVAVMGSSGSGKSTLLRLINHLETLEKGQVLVEGKMVGYNSPGIPFKSARQLAVARAEARVGMVFQSFNLFEHMTVLENVVAAPIYVHGETRSTAIERAKRILDRVGLLAHCDKLPHRLSGGQQQRVAIARSLAIDPKLMLFDEPTSALDPELVGDVLAVMRELANDGMTMIVVTHELRFAMEAADRIVFLGDGRVVEEGSPSQILSHPREAQTKRFLQSLQFQPN